MPEYLINKILFVLPVATQPRYAKRIQSYLDMRFNVTVASFERDYFSKNQLPDQIEYVSLGKVENRNYLKRIPKLIYSFKRLLALGKQNQIIFIFSADILIMLVFFFKKREIYYEIGDIRLPSNNKLITKTYNFLYGKAINKCNKIFVTSIGFKDFLISKYNLRSDKILIIENKLSAKNFPLNKRLDFCNLKGGFTIGIIGLLRYQNVIDFISSVKKTNSCFDIKIFGDGPLQKQMLEFVDDNKIQYFGQFKNPDDLCNIYKHIHLSFVMYNSNDLNVRLALPNKLYESIYFRRPILVSSNTFLEKKVKEYNVGFSWGQDEIGSLVAYLNSVEFIKDYNSLNKSFDLINKNEFLV